MTLQRATAETELVGRRLEGIAYRYNYPSRVTDDDWASSYYEEIVRGADRRTLAHRATFPLTQLHLQKGGAEIGTTTFHHSDDERALMFRAVVDPGRPGDELLEQIDEWRDASVTFDPLRTGRRHTPHHGPIIQRSEIRIVDLSLNPNGTALAKGAEVLAVRASTTPGETSPTPALEQARRARARLLL